jgi:hypothetical protein
MIFHAVRFKSCLTNLALCHDLRYIHNLIANVLSAYHPSSSSAILRLVLCRQSSSRHSLFYHSIIPSSDACCSGVKTKSVSSAIQALSFRENKGRSTRASRKMFEGVQANLEEMNGSGGHGVRSDQSYLSPCLHIILGPNFLRTMKS